MKKIGKGKKLTVVRYLFTYVCAVLVVIPILYMILSAFKNPNEVKNCIASFRFLSGEF